MPAARGVKRAAAAKAESKITKASAGSSKIKKKNVSPVFTAKTIPISTELGQVLTCGQGDVGQLGLGEDFLEKSRFTIVSTLGSTIVDICAGGMHTVCIDKNGDVWTFGCNDEGALGRNTTNNSANEWIPAKVTLPGKVVRVSAGDSHTAALLENGQVYAWGSFRDSHGNMGLTLKGNECSPIEMLPGHKVVQIASGGDHLVMLTDNGQIYTCGCAEQGQLGRVTARSCDRNSRLGLNPLLSPATLNFRPKDKIDFDMLWAGTHCTFAREASKGDIYVWGLNNYQQIGVRKGEPGTVFTPVISEAFAELKNVTWSKITGGPHHTLALDSEGICYVIGRREYGRLGLGENCEDAINLTPVPILKEKKCVQIACGSAASFAVTDTGDVYAWGMGSSGQLGTGTEDDETEPKLLRSKQIEGRFGTNISAGGQHTVLLVKSLEKSNDNTSEPEAASIIPQSKVEKGKASKAEKAEKEDSKPVKADENVNTDVEMKEDTNDAKKNENEKMDVDTPDEEVKKTEKPAKKVPQKRGRKGSVSSTASTESSRSAKAAKNKQNEPLSTVKESQAGEEADEPAPAEPTETKTGGTQDDSAETQASQKSKREESENEEPEAKRKKIDCVETKEKHAADEKKEDAAMETNEAPADVDKSETENATVTPIVVENNKSDRERLSNGNGETETNNKIMDDAPANDVETKTVSEVIEKKCISTESQEKTDDDVTRTDVKT